MTQRDYKQQLLTKLYEPYLKCTQCPLGFLGRKNVVFGEGNPDAKLMFIGEGPGNEEDIQGRPFVGRSGQLLTKILELIGLQRTDIFITNIVKCRPPNNRKPLPQESRVCKNLFLINQIRIIKPKTICTLGASALEGLLEEKLSITKFRGIPLTILETTVVPTYHPAYILRNPKELKTLISDIERAKNLSDL
jgi:uracil-DNA glycosylase